MRGLGGQEGRCRGIGFGTSPNELHNWVAEMLDLGGQVKASPENMVRAMEGRDAEHAGKELGVDGHHA